MNKLNLDFSFVETARKLARNIANDTQKFIDKHTTTSIERTICRLLGIDGVDEFGVPLPNLVVDHIQQKEQINNGIALYLGNTILHTNLSPQNKSIMALHYTLGIPFYILIYLLKILQKKYLRNN